MYIYALLRNFCVHVCECVEPKKHTCTYIYVCL